MKKYFHFILFQFVMSCSGTKTLQSTSLGTGGVVFDKQGHRGCRGLMPENTIPAMIKALDLGVTTLEMDAVITADKKVILSHEPFFNHEITTKPDGSAVQASEERRLNIYKMTFAETLRYDVGKKTHPRFPKQEKMAATKPLLADVVDSTEAHAKRTGRALPFYNIETKSTLATDNVYHPAPAEFVDLLVSVVNSKGIQARTIIQSFDFRTLQYLHTKYPGIKTAALIEDFDKRPFDEQIKALGFVPDIYSPHYSLVTDELISQCREKKIRLIPWTVNSKEEIERLKKMGVDGIITDYPNLFGE